jgi:hypothetical protein
MTPTILDMSAKLKSYGFVIGDREPRLNTNYPGKFMVVEPYEECELPTEDGSDGPWCIVGDDLDVLIADAYENYPPFDDDIE